ncbi:Rha family transcriptional regulator [uncultured Martelella sp.]|uniref:Rha family transcriptional regulator n=1 Tax=uncultured Martelella sp. TaxID=392331 RepID=UPI0029C7D4A1|nr:Rha family transcriptional regulator [uncultured Martelella sp.]
MTAAAENLIEPTVRVQEGNVFADSRDVASYFGKEVKHVHEAIRNLISMEPTLGVANFRPFKIKDLVGERVAYYEMDRDGFTILAMGFTGKRALAFKLKYLDAFNRMQKELNELRETQQIPEGDIGSLAEQRLALDKVREARIAYGPARARALWESLPALPQVPLIAGHESGGSDAAECLRYFVSEPTEPEMRSVGEMLEGALRGDGNDKQALEQFGIAVSPAGLFIARSKPEIRAFWNRTRWATAWVTHIRRSGGAYIGNERMTIGGHQCRPLFIPSAELGRLRRTIIV